MNFLKNEVYNYWSNSIVYRSTIRAFIMQDSITESKTINYILFMVFWLRWQHIYLKKR